MPIPFIVGAAAGVAGVRSAVRGGKKAKVANDEMKSAEKIKQRADDRLMEKSKDNIKLLDSLGRQELNILSSFENFSNIIEKIQGRPKFELYSKEGVDLSEYESEELKKISIGASVVLKKIERSSSDGAAAGVAEIGAVTVAEMILEPHSTNEETTTAHFSKDNNIDGEDVLLGGVGMAAAVPALMGGFAATGIGLLAEGIVLDRVGSKLSDAASEAKEQAVEFEKDVNKRVDYYMELNTAARDFIHILSEAEEQYRKRLATLEHVVNFSEKTEWSEFTEKEKKMTENTVLLVGLLYKICQTKLVLISEDNDIITVNKTIVKMREDEANIVLGNIDKSMA